MNHQRSSHSLVVPDDPRAARRASVVVPPWTSTPLLAASGREGLSIAPALVAVAGVLIARYTGLDESTIGVSLGAANTSAEDGGWQFERCATASDPTFLDVIRLAGAAWARSTGAESGAGCDAISLLLQSDVQAHAITPAPLHGADKVDRRVVLSLEHDGATVRGHLSYAPGCCDEGTAAGIARHFVNLARGLSADPSISISRVEMLDDAERLRILGALVGPDVRYPEGTLHGLFARTSANTPDAIAIVDGRHHVSYGELNRRANRIAHHLRRRGVRAGTAVGLSMRRSDQPIAAAFGILKTGAAYVPLDHTNPEARLREIAVSAQLAMAVTTRDIAGTLEPLGLQLVCVEDPAIASENASNPPVDVDAGAVACFLHTSGSTGRPKVVACVHRSVVNGLSDVPFDRDNPDEICCLNSSLSVGMSLARLFLPLLCGRTLVLIPEERDRDLLQLVDAWETARVGNIVMVTPMLRQLLGFGSELTSKLQNVRTVVVGGALLTPDLMASFAELMPSATLLNGFAATEIGGAALLTRMESRAMPARASIGRPFPNTRVYILDRSMNVLPAGCAGEMFVGSRHQSLGYLGQPRLTAERFVPDPFGSEPGRRLYRTGDVVRCLSDGTVDLVGRVDDQVKVRGYRIELQEIESALLQYPGIAGAAVHAPVVAGERRLAAYIVPREGEAGSVGQVRDFLSRRLPSYMVPSIYVRLEALPLTSTGKTDRAALPPPTFDLLSRDTAYEEPRDDLEREITEMWTQLLGLESVGVHDQFLELGGDSLFATLIAARLRERFGVEVPVVWVFEHPTVAQMAPSVADWLKKDATSDRVAI